MNSTPTTCRPDDGAVAVIRDREAHSDADHASAQTFHALPVDPPHSRNTTRVPGFTNAHGLSYPVVKGLDHRSFVLSYDPRGSIPCLVVIGRDGRVVDVQIGHDERQRDRLIAALSIARARY